MQHLIRVFTAAFSLTFMGCQTTSVRPIEPSANPLSVTCGSMIQCEYAPLQDLVRSTEETANRGRNYLRKLAAEKPAVYQNLNRLQKIIDLDYAKQVFVAANSHETNPDAAASDIMRLSSLHQQNSKSGAGLLLLLNSGKSPTTDILGILAVAGNVSVSSGGTVQLNKSGLSGVTTGSNTYLWWETSGVYTDVKIKMALERYAESEDAYLKEAAPVLTRLSLDEKRELMQAFDSLLREIHMDFKTDFPKIGHTYDFILASKQELAAR